MGIAASRNDVSSQSQKIRRGRHRPRPRQAGFTIMELMIIITIISVTAGLAGPSIHDSLSERRAGQAPLDVIRMMNRARSESIAYGRAHLVRFSGASPGTALAPGTFTIYRGVSSSCNSALYPWTTLTVAPASDTTQLETVSMAGSPYASGTTNVVSQSQDGFGLVDLCFEPFGTMLSRTGADVTGNNPFTANNAVNGGFRFSFQRFENAAALGPVRQIVVPIGGAAREFR